MDNNRAGFNPGGLVVYAPPNGRAIKIGAGRIWNSGEVGVVFFESTSYGDLVS